ncbi:hypothetical protein AL471_014570 [Vibrio alginolyticus]|uniref:hypothetical protein n=1 Tax=Vibrio alginolyticus TaxID=663 RepID=UPI00076C7774|nr:hypothetical protein [Vibrio alginolyticus]PNP21997.1 hypothetical protein AL471_014570 [Vibrio alginolyticus]
MKLSQLKIEPHLIEAFISHLKRNGYAVVVAKNEKQPHWVNHGLTPDESHITELDEFGNLIVPVGLHKSALEFLCVPTTK